MAQFTLGVQISWDKVKQNFHIAQTKRFLQYKTHKSDQYHVAKTLLQLLHSVGKYF